MRAHCNDAFKQVSIEGRKGVLGIAPTIEKNSYQGQKQKSRDKNNIHHNATKIGG
jgi:hypothetical protein